jgi:hypothetical protein
VTPLPSTPISVTQVPSTPVLPVVRSRPIKHYGSVDNLVRYQFDICLAHILFWPKFDVVSLRKTPAKVSFAPTLVAPVTEIHEVAEMDDGDSVYSETEDFPFRVPAVELFPEDQEHSLNFIVTSRSPLLRPPMLNRKIPHQIVMVVLGRMSGFPVQTMSVSFLLPRSRDQLLRSVVTPLQMSLTATLLTPSAQLRYRSFQLLRRLHIHRNLHREQLRPVLPVLRVLSLPPTVWLDD